MARNKRDNSSRKRHLPEVRGGHSTKRQRHDAQETSTQLYAPEDPVLVLGDGDFSFSRGLVKHRGTGRGVFATSFDSEKQVHSKYPNAQECIATVRSAHGLVLHDVDATKLLELPQQAKTGTGLKPVPDFFQYIIFNFPHSGQQRVHINRALLLNFFESARDRLTVHGEAHVTLKTRPPYSNWFIEDQAKAAGFVMKERRKFNIKLFLGYRHRTTDPQAKKFEAELCITYVFVVNRSKYPFQKSRAALTAASAEIAATEASEQYDLAAAILNIAKANVASQKKDEEKKTTALANTAANKRKKKETRRDKPAKPTKKPNARAGMVEAQPEAEKQTTQNQVVHKNGGKLWKPLHRRAGGNLF
ncbi:hypothetical protein V7S43_008239 [Phytophthora oleae]|uniref:25S rRNA (uridine-N(3))-methyltransferase BMT5-like domain-containing protein n=1 Tax=Phytophthora oleae TaxID=2107226 RepID=A0ABD3FJZ3_9STRA